MMKPATDGEFPWTGIFFGAPILGIWYWCTDQVIVQRVLFREGRGPRQAGTIFAGFLKVLPVFVLVLAGADRLRALPSAVHVVGGKSPTAIRLSHDDCELASTGLVGLMIARS